MSLIPRKLCCEVLETPQGHFHFLNSLQELSTHWIFCFALLTKVLNESCVVGSYPTTHALLVRKLGLPQGHFHFLITSFKKIRSHTIQNTARVPTLADEVFVHRSPINFAPPYPRQGNFLAF